MKKFSLVALLSSVATYVTAGNLAPAVIQDPEVISDAAPMGSSGAWIIPLILIAAVAIVVATSDDDSDDSEDSETSTTDTTTTDTTPTSTTNPTGGDIN